MKPPSSSLLTFLLLGMLASSSWATTINWGGKFRSVNVQADGETDLVGFNFTAGTFGDFDPTADNLTQWVQNWSELDRAAYDPNFGLFSGTVELNDNSNFSANEQVYFWIFNRSLPEDSPQWALLTSDLWNIPDTAEDGTHGRILNWWITDPGTRPLVGGFEGTFSEIGLLGGEPPEGFTLQTAMVSDITGVVPEPRALVLLGFAALFLIKRRR